jgi:hypothetical protein
MYHRRDAVSIIATRSNQKPTKKAARSVPEHRLGVELGKDRREIQMGLCARTEVTAGMSIHRDDRLYPGLEIAAHSDERPD